MLSFQKKKPQHHTKPPDQDLEGKKKDPHRGSHQLHKDECEHQNQDNEQEIEK